MAKINSHTSIKELLERVRREFGFEDSVHIDDVREWVWDAIGIIGSNELLIDKTELLRVQDHRVRLPIDVFDLTDHQVRDAETKIVLKKSNNLSFVKAFDPSINIDASITMDEEGDMDFNSYYQSIILPGYKHTGYFYTIKGKFIYTSIDKCEIELGYRAFPIDDIGGPMVPDDPQILRYLVWYIGERVAFKYMLQDKLSERKYQAIKQEYTFIAGAAKSKMDTLDVPDMHNFKHRVLQMSKQINAFERGFE